MYSYQSEILKQAIQKIACENDHYKKKMIEDFIGNYLLKNDFQLDFVNESLKEII